MPLRVSRASEGADGVPRHLGGRWNISLFHYRNHGADFGRVLAAFEVPVDERDVFHAFLETLAYRYTLEPDNRAFKLFLG